jgi:hypothetical protein
MGTNMRVSLLIVPDGLGRTELPWRRPRCADRGVRGQVNGRVSGGLIVRSSCHQSSTRNARGCDSTPNLVSMTRRVAASRSGQSLLPPSVGNEPGASVPVQSEAHASSTRRIRRTDLPICTPARTRRSCGAAVCRRCRVGRCYSRVASGTSNPASNIRNRTSPENARKFLVAFDTAA